MQEQKQLVAELEYTAIQSDAPTLLELDTNISEDIETDEDKNTYDLWKKYGSDKGEFVLGFDPFFSDAKYKVYLKDIININQLIFVADLSVQPVTIVGKRAFVYHRGQRISDVIDDDTFDYLESKMVKTDVSYTFADMSDPVSSRYSYHAGKSPTPITPSIVIKSREVRLGEYQKELEEQKRIDALVKETRRKEAQREMELKKKKEQPEVAELVLESPVEILNDHLKKDIIEGETISGDDK